MRAIKRLIEAAEEVHSDCFPGGAGSADIGDALAFLLGIPCEEVSGLVDAVGMDVEREALDVEDKSEIFTRTFQKGIELGIASERVNRLELPDAA